MKKDYLLLIETSSKVCSTALVCDDGVILAEEYAENAERAQSTLIAPMVDKLIQEANLKPTIVGISAGPGSYTGLRIGASIAKGLCFGLNIPLVPISTLELMAYMVSMMPQSKDVDLLCPMIDARRMEVYTTLFRKDGTQVMDECPMIIDQQSFAQELKDQKILFFGSGMEKCKNILYAHSPNASFLSEIEPMASYMTPIVVRKIEENKLADIAYWEPNYMKEFQATVAKNKVLNKQLNE